MTHISLAHPDITRREIKAVNQVLTSGRLAMGPFTQKFEQAMADYIGVKHAVAVNNGTAGLHLLIKILDLRDGDEVITSPFSFIASANAPIFERAEPIFCDIDPKTLCLNPAKIEAKITSKTKAILAIDVFGHPCDWTALQKIASKHKLFLIEDSCEALGSTWHGKKCGSFGIAGVLAFYPNKQITTGEGGMIVTNSSRIAKLARALRNQGRLHSAWLKHDILGYNYRLDEMSAALGAVQMSRLGEILSKRAKIARLYQTELTKLNSELIVQRLSPLELPESALGATVSWFVYVIRLAAGTKIAQRNAVLSTLNRRGIESRNYFPPIHLQPYYQKTFKYQAGDFPITEQISARTIALPFHHKLTKTQIVYIVHLIKQILTAKH
ncbi:MAG TPA: polysaccharide biosynthesis protein [Candidatus Jacksonbacteria bacterium]|nr:MAG: putative pyridoxal phosphate-dependent enzyme [Parcubacteria group bacterium GW2011_GWC2_44_22]OGY76475.1 MAG: polysaccharide biosynthesis protein [Candidatus Jacksonbacteria bacterium RIFOXYB2_FULL_44_15]OGY76846.1 MAG: polysaccharide biosynthesis protein [Candidatus Jacksonbacteria bacterium RIFOXYA2_FULL_43_12]OGY82205.1 MAG: polysaccharide biosynthesis protein [Candidatus Jacksonbacteria bacterium RIFOXYD2_FULL_43_21]HBH45811.1 polysaccharide biosynthesis protein [Candidatus Jackson